MQKNLYCKTLAVGIIVLFVGVSISSAISIGNESVETTIKFYGSKGVIPHKVKLTKQDAYELDRLFDCIKSNLNSAETNEEIDEILNEAIVSLYEYGMLPKDLTVEEARQMITGGYQNPNIIYPYRNFRDNDENFLCQVVGRTTETYMFNLPPIRNIILKILRSFSFIYWNGLNFPFYSGYIGQVSISRLRRSNYGGDKLYPSEGWVWTRGINGIITWSGALRGELGSKRVFEQPRYGESEHVYMGIAHFRGFWIDLIIYFLPKYFLGVAGHVDIGYVTS